MHSKEDKIRKKRFNKVVRYLRNTLPDEYKITTGKTFNVKCGGQTTSIDYIQVQMPTDNIPPTTGSASKIVGS